MSQLLINKYLGELATLKKVSGTHRESVVREAFKDLLKAWGRSLDLTFIPEYELETRTKERRYVDGALLHTLRVPFGYWEAKDEKDDLDAEIAHKFKRGYPKTNILFDDSKQVVLIQHGEEVMRCGVEDVVQLEKLLKLFFGYERPEIEAFRKAVEQFKVDLPAVLESLRAMIEASLKTQAAFRTASEDFLKHAQEAINPNLTEADVREMLIQHILTGEVFQAVFPGTNYHEDNNIACALHKLEATFFTGNTKHQTLKGLAAYYGAIRKAAAEIDTHHEKQAFLKAIYENFYKVYNPKAADRLGVVYTPNEIVRFMIESADWLCEHHFKRSLVDKDVHILDPATGTGTFVCELIEHFRGQPAKLRHKYRHELHANEVAILPYYVANLNIEATYAQVMGEYQEFHGLCFVDTLDNTYALRKHAGHMDDLFGSVSDDNVKRIRIQNSRRISVIIGNPPYNANQLNENENNKNREYPEIDKRIKDTYIAASTAQKTKVYDMYSRFFRWAADRLDENGVLAFITNRSFIDSRTFDGFRAIAAKEFNEIRIVDLGGDVRANPKLSGTTHNVFGIQTGVAISFMVKRAKQKGCRIFYARRPEMETAEEKLTFLHNARIRDVAFDEVVPDAKHNWVNLASNDFTDLLPLITKEAKLASKSSQERAIFKVFSLGVSTSRDEWVYGENEAEVRAKTAFLIDIYNLDVQRAKDRKKALDASELTYEIKWTRAVKSDLAAGVQYQRTQGTVVCCTYRPFIKKALHFNGRLIEVQYQQTKLFGEHGNAPNRVIAFTDAGSQKPFMALVCENVFDYHFVGAAAAASGLPLYRYEGGQRIENVTDWGLNKFKEHYKPETGTGKLARKITKEAIFHYCYAVLHDPVYREKYAQNLKREFPRIPFYPGFWRWADWGRALMDLHIGYEAVEPWALTRTDIPDEKARAAGQSPKAMLKADKDAGRIQLDSETTLSDIPPEAWDYKLGNRSALEWILDQYKEKKPKDPTIREKFDSYRFAAYKDKVIDLLMRVTTVSVRTVEITRQMQEAAR
ncbi:type ISP restriction/modification enzyme [Thiobacillus sedimenti]|uniref:site-specific DNA-methyltransferase (adenine-specific) n=1 Tax=Thiobacillus sedimenti TaxID=3110231 RepID=A0ABZ1CMQ3_9PROT|nr:type ISP restriction/modification enzyme [Thiobacillus sp. SCUT-2]WRS40682.1 type ISP restriction/modification enzyme [Thiobacillus sp. SCUT-2]